MSTQGYHSFAVIGFGAITEEILLALEATGRSASLAGVLVRPGRLAEFQSKAAGKFPVVCDLAALLELRADVIAECAGHGAMREFGAGILANGTDLLCTSVGVLADREFSSALMRGARGRLLIPSGAVAGLDGLLAARSAGLRSVTYTSVKPPVAWKGTPGEALVSAAPGIRLTFFQGTAREAAIQYPQNANVGAAVSFAGLGLDRTVVKLVSDPEASGPLGVIDAEGDFGRFRFEILAYASRSNPKTSALTAHSVVAAVHEGTAFAVGRDRLGAP
jgi:aspartate dehydrogenase